MPVRCVVKKPGIPGFFITQQPSGLERVGNPGVHHGRSAVLLGDRRRDGCSHAVDIHAQTPGDIRGELVLCARAYGRSETASGLLGHCVVFGRGAGHTQLAEHGERVVHWVGADGSYRESDLLAQVLYPGRSGGVEIAGAAVGKFDSQILVVAITAECAINRLALGGINDQARARRCGKTGAAGTQREAGIETSHVHATSKGRSSGGQQNNSKNLLHYLNLSFITVEIWKG